MGFRDLLTPASPSRSRVSLGPQPGPPVASAPASESRTGDRGDLGVGSGLPRPHRCGPVPRSPDPSLRGPWAGTQPLCVSVSSFVKQSCGPELAWSKLPQNRWRGARHPRVTGTLVQQLQGPLSRHLSRGPVALPLIRSPPPGTPWCLSSASCTGWREACPGPWAPTPTQQGPVSPPGCCSAATRHEVAIHGEQAINWSSVITEFYAVLQVPQVKLHCLAEGLHSCRGVQ